MIQYAYLVIEGPHDVEFVGQFMKRWGFSRVKMMSELDEFWYPLVPREFPYADDLLRRMPVPTFFKSATHSIALHNAIGDSNIIRTIRGTLAVTSWEANSLVGLGIVLDADSEISPKERFDQIKEGLQQLDFIPALPELPGKVALGKPRCGIFVMPDNLSAGTLEDLLLECAEQVYPSLLQCTQEFIGCVEPVVTQFKKKKDRRDFEKPAGRKKVTVGCIANVLRPGKSVQVSIQDNQWVTEETVTLPNLAHFNKFIQELFALSSS
ncbi:MAG: DUF3226 domain-containing protein [Pseudomonadota bacterium]